MKQVIAAIDFSPGSDEVVARAASIARAFSAYLALIHVAAPNPDFVGLEAGPQTVRDERARELRDEHRELQQRARTLRDEGVEAKAFLVEGRTVDTILERARHLDAELIVLGSHGHGAVYRLLLGSVSEGVLRRSDVPVLIVPTRASKSVES